MSNGHVDQEALETQSRVHAKANILIKRSFLDGGVDTQVPDTTGWLNGNIIQSLHCDIDDTAAKHEILYNINKKV